MHRSAAKEIINKALRIVYEPSLRVDEGARSTVRYPLSRQSERFRQDFLARGMGRSGCQLG